MKFNYQAKTKAGQSQSGVIEATSRGAAIDLLRSHGLFVTALEEIKAPFYARRLKFFDRIPKREIVNLSRQMAIMFKSEIPLVEVLNALAKQVQNEQLREKIYDLAEKVEGGNSLSKALSAHPDVFSAFYQSMVKSGEASGKLSDVFVYLADYLEKEYDFNRKVKAALTYPVFLLVVAMGVVAVVVFFVVPQLSQILAESAKEIPLFTKFLLGSAFFLRRWGLLIILVAVSGAIAVRFYFKTKEGKALLDRILLSAPLLNKFLKSIYLARFSLNLSTLISGGLPIIQALEATSEVVGSEVYKKIIRETAEGVKRGEAISAVLTRYPEEFPPLFIQMLLVGEKTGRMQFSFKSTADFYQKEVDYGLAAFTSLLEPVLMIIFGLLVGTLMAAVILPVYQIITGF